MTHLSNQRLSRRDMLRLMGASAGALATTLAISACAPAAMPSAPAAAPATAGTDVRLWSMQYPPHDQAWNMLAGQYMEQNPGVTVTVEPQADWLTKYASGFSAGTAGDLVALHGAGAGSFMATNRLLPLTDVLDGASAINERFYPAVMDYYRYQGDVYGIPLANNTPGIGFITNLDLYDKHGLTALDTFADWNQVWEIAEQMTERNDAGEIQVAGMSMRNYHNLQYLCGFILEQGGTYFDDVTGEWKLQTPEAKEALTQIFYDSIFTRNVDTPDLPDCFEGLAQARIANGAIWIDYIPYGKTAFPDGRFGFTMRPPIAGNKAIVVGEGAWGVVVNRDAKQVEDAMGFVKFLNQDETMLRWVQSQNALPSVYSLVDNPWYQTEDAKFLLPALRTLNDWVWMGAVGNKYAMDDIFYPMLQSLSLGDISVDAMLAQLEVDLTAKVQSFRSDSGYEV